MAVLPVLLLSASARLDNRRLSDVVFPAGFLVAAAPVVAVALFARLSS